MSRFISIKSNNILIGDTQVPVVSGEWKVHKDRRGFTMNLNNDNIIPDVERTIKENFRITSLSLPIRYDSKSFNVGVPYVGNYEIYGDFSYEYNANTLIRIPFNYMNYVQDRLNILMELEDINTSIYDETLVTIVDSIDKGINRIRSSSAN